MKLPYFMWYANDAEGDDFYASLNDAEGFTYHRMLNRAWINDGVPADLDELAAVLHKTRKYMDAVWPKLSRRWVISPRDPQKIVNPRQEEEREFALSKGANMKRPGNQNARKGNTDKRNCVSSAFDCVPNAFTRASVCVSDSGSDLSEELKPKFPQSRKVIEHPGAPTQESDDRFEEIWQRWPRQTNKNSAAMDWVSVVTPANVAQVIACADRYLASDEARRGIVKSLGSTVDRTGWLIDCARDGWESDWPKAAQPAQKKSNFDLAMEGLR